jgi:hypothetical protein
MSNEMTETRESASNDVALQSLGWTRYSERWPTKADCDPYGNIETAHSGARGFIQLGEAESFAYNLKQSSFWRTPTPLPDFFGMP